MNTSQFVTLMMKETGNVLNRTEMLQYINYAQIDIFGLNTYLNETKPAPYLDTDGSTTYTLADNVRTVTRVYMDATSVSYRRSYSDLYGGSSDAMVHRDVREITEDVHIIPAKSITTGVGNCQIIFELDPGTTDDVFLLEQYEWPDELSSEAIPLSVDEVTARSYLRYLVFKKIEEAGYAQSIYNDSQVEKAEADFFRRVKRPGRTSPSKRRRKIRGGGA